MTHTPTHGKTKCNIILDYIPAMQNKQQLLQGTALEP